MGVPLRAMRAFKLFNLRATQRHLPYECYLPPDTSERAPPNPAQKAGTRSLCECLQVMYYYYQAM